VLFTDPTGKVPLLLLGEAAAFAAIWGKLTYDLFEKVVFPACEQLPRGGMSCIQPTAEMCGASIEIYKPLENETSADMFSQGYLYSPWLFGDCGYKLVGKPSLINQ